VQAQLYQLKLVLNAEKTKVMFFSNARKNELDLNIVTDHGKTIEIVSSYKYLGFLIDDQLSFKLHIQNLVKRLKLKLGFFFRNKSCFTFSARKRLVNATFLSIIDYGDLLYMNAPTKYLQMLDSVFHGALTFISNCKPLTHHCTLYSTLNLPSLSNRRLTHLYIFIYKGIIGRLPCYISKFLSFTQSTYGLRSQKTISLNVPQARTDLFKKAFMCFAPSTWNELQKTLKLQCLIPLNDFKGYVKTIEHESIHTCKCFN